MLIFRGVRISIFAVENTSVSFSEGGEGGSVVLGGGIFFWFSVGKMTWGCRSHHLILNRPPKSQPFEDEQLHHLHCGKGSLWVPVCSLFHQKNIIRIHHHYWLVFPKIGEPPKNGWFTMENPKKWMIWVENPDFQKHPCQSVDLGLPTRLIYQQKYVSPFQRRLPNEIHDLHRNQVHLRMVPSCPESSQNMEKTEGFTTPTHPKKNTQTTKKLPVHPFWNPSIWKKSSIIFGQMLVQLVPYPQPKPTPYLC